MSNHNRKGSALREFDALIEMKTFSDAPIRKSRYQHHSADPEAKAPLLQDEPQSKSGQAEVSKFIIVYIIISRYLKIFLHRNVQTCSKGSITISKAIPYRQSIE